MKRFNCLRNFYIFYPCNSSCSYSTTRLLSSSDKRAKRIRNNEKLVMKFKDSNNLPEFKDLLRQLYRSSHPDLVRSTNPEMSSINDLSLQKLNGILSTIKGGVEFPSATIQDIPFFVKKPNNEYEKISLRIHLAGGDCRHQLAGCFEKFFSKAGINEGKFRWGDEFFPISSFK